MYLKGWLRIVGPVLIALVLASATAARADLIPIGPFTGELSESWESFPTSFSEGDHLPNPTVFLGGAATIANAYMVIYEPPIRPFTLGSSGSALTADGAKGMGIERFADTAAITFQNPVLRFGAYWGAWTHAQLGGDPAFVTLSFYDENGALIGADTFQYGRTAYYDGVLEWHGWSSTVGIKTLEYTEDKVVIDSLHADPLPEPLTAALLLFLVSARCRRPQRDSL